MAKKSVRRCGRELAVGDEESRFKQRHTKMDSKGKVLKFGKVKVLERIKRLYIRKGVVVRNGS